MRGRIIAAAAALYALTTVSAQDTPKPTTISGKATFKGDKIPSRGTVPVSDKEPSCVDENNRYFGDRMIVDRKTGAIKNVFVRVAKAPAGMAFPVPDKAHELRQKGCRYAPHVSNMLIGQNLAAINDCGVTHNVNFKPRAGDNVNQVQKPGDRDEWKIEAEEVPLQVGCDIHAWMRAYVWVLPHTLCAVTDDKGEFTLPPLPAGTYDLIAWHEEFGERTAKVEVKAGETKSVDFVFEPKK